MRSIHTITSSTTKIFMEQMRNLLISYGGVVDSESITGSSADYFLMSFPVLNPGHQFRFAMSSTTYSVACCKLGSTTEFVWINGISKTYILNTIEVVIITDDNLLVLITRSSTDYLNFYITPFGNSHKVSGVRDKAAKYLDDTVYNFSSLNYDYDATTADGKIYLSPILLLALGATFYTDIYAMSYIHKGTNISPGVRMGDFVEDELNYYYWLGNSLYCKLAK